MLIGIGIHIPLCSPFEPDVYTLEYSSHQHSIVSWIGLQGAMQPVVRVLTVVNIARVPPPPPFHIVTHCLVQIHTCDALHHVIQLKYLLCVGVNTLKCPPSVPHRSHRVGGIFITIGDRLSVTASGIIYFLFYKKR